jgi:hypothetical protein
MAPSTRRTSIATTKARILGPQVQGPAGVTVTPLLAPPVNSFSASSCVKLLKGETAGDPMANKQASTGLLSDSSAVSVRLEPAYARMVGMRPSRTLALAIIFA